MGGDPDRSDRGDHRGCHIRILCQQWWRAVPPWGADRFPGGRRDGRRDFRPGDDSHPENQEAGRPGQGRGDPDDSCRKFCRCGFHTFGFRAGCHDSDGHRPGQSAPREDRSGSGVQGNTGSDPCRDPFRPAGSERGHG